MCIRSVHLTGIRFKVILHEGHRLTGAFIFFKRACVYINTCMYVGTNLIVTVKRRVVNLTVMKFVMRFQHEPITIIIIL